MTCCAAIAHQHVAHKRVKTHVEQCCEHQESNGQHGLIPRPRDAAGHGSSGHNGQPQRWRKILLTPQILTAADAAATKTVGLEVRLPLITAPATAIAANAGGRGIRCRDSATAADRTLKYNVTAHGGESSKNGGGSAFRKEVQSGKRRKIGEIAEHALQRQTEVPLQQSGRHFAHENENQYCKQNARRGLRVPVLKNAANQQGCDRGRHNTPKDPQAQP